MARSEEYKTRRFEIGLALLAGHGHRTDVWAAAEQLLEDLEMREAYERQHVPAAQDIPAGPIVAPTPTPAAAAPSNPTSSRSPYANTNLHGNKK